MEVSNIILITIDSLRYDHLGCYGYARNTSPNIDSLAARGVKFLQAISNGGGTPTAFPPILASALPPLDRTESGAVLQRSATLAEVLKDAGYQTAAFHSNPFLSRLYGYSKGFDLYDDSFRQFSLKRLRHWLRTAPKIARLRNRAIPIFEPFLWHARHHSLVNAEELISKSKSWVQTCQGRFFLWLHFMDVHHPYMPAAKYLNQFYDQPVSRRYMYSLWQKMRRKPNELSQPEIEMLIHLYDANIKYTDDIIGSLLVKLGNHLANTIMIITADHGDEFGEHGKFAHRSVYEALLHVPLIIAGPGIKGGTSVKQQVSLIDLAPTIAELVGISSPKSFHGQSLLPLIRGETRSAEYTISTQFEPDSEKAQISYRTPNWKYIRSESLDSSGLVLKEEVYNLINDPGETKNLHGTDLEEVRRFHAEAINKLSQFKQLKVEESTDYEKQRIKTKLSKLRKLQDEKYGNAKHNPNNN